MANKSLRMRCADLNQIMNKIVIVALIVTLAGCAKPMWVNPNVSQQQAQKEYSECQYDAVKHGRSYNGMDDPIAAAFAIESRKSDLMTACMQMKGYHQETRN